MHIYGITGPSGAGKSLLCEYMAAHGIPHIDADALYHELLIPPSPVVDALRLEFGDAVMTPEGGIDRKALSAIVFHDPEKLALLNRTVLTLVLSELRVRLSRLREAGATAVAVDAPTLIESGFHAECDTVIVVLSPREERIARIMARDHLSPQRAEERVNAQSQDEFYTAVAHVVLYNDGDRDTFFAKAEAALPAVSQPNV